MVALPDIADLQNASTVECQARRMRRGQQALKRAVLMAVGSACLMAAVGVWGFQPGAGDAAMQLIKLLVSAVLLIAGMLFISGLRDRAGLPEVHIDPFVRQVNQVEFDGTGSARIVARHDFDRFSQVDMRNGILTAYDSDGNKVFELPVDDPHAFKAFRTTI